MKNLLPIAISSGTIAALWATSSINLQMSTFAGFLAWSTYFAAGGGKKGFKTALLNNFSGICWGLIIIFLTNLLTPYFGNIPSIGISTAIGSAMIILQSKISFLHYIPGAFIGLSAFFATGSKFLPTVIAMIIGAFLGLISEKLGEILNIDYLK
jgi:uncharacterized protein involved in cysteine biosynthesis